MALAPLPTITTTPRYTSATLTAQRTIAIPFPVFGDGSDMLVALNGVKQASGWALVSPSGSLATLPRPITNANIEFSSDVTGFVEVWGRHVPRRMTNMSESVGPTARDFNYEALLDKAILSEMFERLNRSIELPYGVTGMQLLKSSDLQGRVLGFDALGNVSLYTPVLTTIGPGQVINSNLANMAAGTIKGRAPGTGTGAPSDLTPAQLGIAPAPSTSGGAYGVDGGASGDVFYWRRTLAGSKTVGADGVYEIFSPSAFMWDIRTDAATPSDQNEFLIGFRFRHLVTSSLASGGREGLSTTLEMRSATAAGNLQRHYTSLQSKTYAYVGDGGTGLGVATARGAYFGSAAALYLGDPYSVAAATNIFDGVGAEFNTFVKASTTVRYLSGFAIALNNAARGSEVDAFMRFTGMSTVGLYAGHIGTDYGLLFTNVSGADPTYSGSILLGSKFFNLGTGAVDTTLRNITHGIDLSGFNVTGNLLRGRTARLSDDGTVAYYGGTGTVVLRPNDTTVFAATGVSGGNAQINLIGQGAGLAPYFSLSGTPTDIDFIVRAKGTTGTLDVNFPTATTIGAAGGASALPATPLGYITVKINGTARKIPFYNV
ncbi:MAG: hypothetical protein ACRCTG_15440 [Aestuariivirga sp.]